MTTRHVRLLGGFHLTIDDTTHRDGDLASNAARVVKILALQPDARLSRDELIATLWPDADRDTGANRLYKALHQLRTTVGDDHIVTTDDGTIALATDVSVDVAEFRAAATSDDPADLDRALDLYPGELLPDDPYDEWTLRPREHLADLARRTRLTLARHHTHSGDFARAEALLTDALMTDPDNHEALAALTHLRRPDTDADIAGEAPCPPIHHLTTPDGVRLAYQTFGHGPPLVHMTQLPWNDLVGEWAIPAWRAWHQGLARGRRVVRYDGRGVGQSQRDIDHLTVDDVVTDLTTVVDHLDLDTFDLFSGLNTAIAAITYATSHADRVRRLVLWAPYARAADLIRADMPQAASESAEVDWNLMCRGAAGLTMSHGHHAIANQMAEMLTDASSFATYSLWFSELAGDDATDLLSKLTMPVLLLHPPQPEYPGQEAAIHTMTARIPDGRLVRVPNSAYSPIAGDTDHVLATIHAFFAEPA